MSPTTLEVIQIIGTVIIAAITTYGSIQLARIAAKVQSVDNNLDTVHKQINSRMDEMLANKQEIGEQLGKEKAEKEQDVKDKLKQ